MRDEEFSLCTHAHMFSPAFFSIGEFHQCGDTLSPSTVHNTGEAEDRALRRAPESVAPVVRSRAESAGSASDTDPSEEGLSQPLLLEDPLVLNTPQISIPKKQEAVFKRNKWRQGTKFPNVSKNMLCCLL